MKKAPVEGRGKWLPQLLFPPASLLFVYWLCWVFIDALELSLVAGSGASSQTVVHGFLIVVISLVAMHGLNSVASRLRCPVACGIFLKQRSNHWITREVLPPAFWAQTSRGRSFRNSWLREFEGLLLMGLRRDCYAVKSKANAWLSNNITIVISWETNGMKRPRSQSGLPRLLWGMDNELRKIEPTGSKMSQSQGFVRFSTLSRWQEREVAIHVTAETLMGLEAKIQGRLNLQGHWADRAEENWLWDVSAEGGHRRTGGHTE